MADVRDTTYPEQDAFVMDPARYVSACCTRRAGKSTAIAYRFIRTMLKHPGCFCPYVALTRESAKNIMWGMLHEVCDKHGVKGDFRESDLTLTLANGAKLQLFGADMKNFIRRLKGIKTPGAAIDELQDFPPHVESLIDDVLGPAILDYHDGWIAITGTPGPLPSGYFFEVSEERKHGFSRHAWSLFNNPYLEVKPKDFIDDLKRKKAWSDDNPTLMREYFGRWVLDLDALVIKYEPSRNGFSALPRSVRPWSYVVGVDLGFNDADAIAVIAYNDLFDSCYLVEEIVKPQQGITELVAQLEDVIKRYNPGRVVMDTGGLGAKIAEEMRRRYSLPIVAAEKTRKNEFYELLNDALRMGRFFAKPDGPFAADAARLKWDWEKSTPDKLVVSDTFHSDALDATLYSFREALHWLHEPAIEKPKPGEPGWFQEQEDETVAMLEQRLEEDKMFNQEWAGVWNVGET